MRTAFATLTFVMLLSTQAAAQSRALDLVRSECVAQNADPDAISRDLSAMHWRQLSDEEQAHRDLSLLAVGFVMHWTRSQAWGPEDGEHIMITLGDGPLGESGARARFCLISEARPFSRQVRDVRAWLGFQRFQTWGPGADMFAYIRGDAGALRNGAAISAAERDEAARAGRFGFVQVVGDTTSSLINFSVIEPSPE